MNKAGKEFNFWFNVVFTLTMYYVVINSTSLKLSKYYLALLILPVIVVALIILKIQANKKKVLQSEHKLDKEVQKLKKQDQKVIKI